MPPKRKAKQAAVPVPQNPQELEEVLTAFLSPNDAAIKKATQTLRAFLAKPSSVPVLFHRLSQENSAINARQLACVLICKKIQSYWGRMQKTHVLNPQQSDANVCRQYILTILHSGTAPSILIHSLSYLTSLIARMDFRRGRWTELVQWLQGAVNSPNVNHVEAAFRILRSVLSSNASKYLESNAGIYIEAALRAIANPQNPIIRYRALLALEVALDAYVITDKGEAHLEQIVSGLIGYIPTCNDNHEYDSVATIIQILIKSTDFPWFDKYNAQLFQGFSQIVTEKFLDIDPKVPSQAVLFLCEYINSKPLLLVSTTTEANGKTVKLLEIAFFICLSLMCQEDSAPFDAGDTPMKMGIRILEAIYEFVPRDEVMSVIIPRFMEFVQSENCYQRRAAYILITTALEQQPLVTVQTMIPFNGSEVAYAEAHLRIACSQLVRETDPSVVHSICLSLSWLSQHIPEWLRDEKLVTPGLQAILSALAIPQIATTESRPMLFQALSGFLDTAQSDVLEVAEPTVQVCIAQAKLSTDPEQVGPALDCLSNLANGLISNSAKLSELVEKYNIMYLLQSILAAPRTPENATLYNQSLNVVSNFGTTIGAENWSPQLREMILTLTNTIINTEFEEDDYTGISGSLTFLGNLANGLAPLFETDENIRNIFVVTYCRAITALRSLSGVHFKTDDQDAPKLGGFEDVAAEEDDEEEEDDELFDDDEDAYFDTDSLECKATAFQVLSLVVTALGPNFTRLQLPELIDVEIDPLNTNEDARTKPVTISPDPIYRALHYVNDTCSYVSDSFLNHGLQTLCDIGLLVLHLSSSTAQPTVITPPPPQYKAYMNTIVTRIIDVIEEDDDADVVSQAFNILDTLMEHGGAGILPFEDESAIKQFYEAITNILSEQAPCFFKDEFKDDRSESGQAALEAACIFLGNYAHWLGPRFAVEVLTDDIYNKLELFTNTTRPDSFRECTVACIAEIVEFSGIAILPRLNGIFNLALHLFNDKAANVRHNALFLLGECATATIRGPCNLTIPDERIPQVMQELSQFIIPPSQYESAKSNLRDLSDNATSAGIKLHIAYPTVLGTQVLPQLLSSLPFKNDLLEALKIVVLLPRLYELFPDVSRQFTAVFIRQIATVIYSRVYIARIELKQDLLNVAKYLCSNFPAEAQVAAQSMTQEEGKSLQEAIQ